MSEWAAYLLWVACGLPFVVVAAHEFWHIDRGLGICVGLFFALALGPFSLALICYNRDNQKAAPK